MDSIEKLVDQQGYTRPFHEFQKLMSHRVREVLLVSSLYDSFILEEDGRLYEMILSGYIDLNLSHAPGFTRVSSGSEALRIALESNQFDLIITTMNLRDMNAPELALKAREVGLSMPIVLLTYDKRELSVLSPKEYAVFEKVFVWQGDFRIMIAIIKVIEDQMNLELDTKLVGVQTIILVEDNVSFYSSYLPLIYTEVLKHHQSLISEGMNMAHKLLRMRARPKILMCSTYEEALGYYRKYEHCVLGVISDIEFPRNGVKDPEAGIRLAKEIQASHFDIPILLQSDSVSCEETARQLGVSFVLKTSPSLLEEVREFMVQYFSLGDFIFRMPDGEEVARAADLRDLERQLKRIPDESLLFHSKQNHFSRWLKARTEFWLAHKLRPRQVSEFESVQDLRQHLIRSLKDFRREQGRGLTSDFDPRTFDPASSFARIGGGSLGGKARGLAFINSLLNSYRLSDQFAGIQVAVPPLVVLGTEVFDQFLSKNNLQRFALHCDDEEELFDRFRDATLPSETQARLSEYLELVNCPLAVRSSSLLEDSRYQPFAGVYRTDMLPNSHKDPEVRLEELMAAIKRVYASTYTRVSKGYIKATSYRLEEEKMAVIIQKLVGTLHENRFYPDFSGVVRSHNFYPTAPMVASDGIASVALGLGKPVVEGELAVRFCPKYPRHVIQFSDTASTLKYSQKWFYVLELEDPEDSSDHSRDLPLIKHGLEVAEHDGTLAAVGSTFSAENDAIYDGISRKGMRLVTFAPILKSDLIPLPEILQLIMDLGRLGMNTPVEIEFAVNYPDDENAVREFAFLQIRPLVASRESDELEVNGYSSKQMICQSNQVLGNGQISDIRDIVMVDIEKFDRARSQEVAAEIGQFNSRLMADKTSYLLIGVGRWGSADPWLGIPVSWDQIAGARVIIETDFKDIKVEPSQGSHFFQNITSFQIGYFTVNANVPGESLDWNWLNSQKVLESKKFTSHIRLKKPITIRMNGHSHKGVILKPGI